MLHSNFWDKYFKVYDVLNHITPYQRLLDEIVLEAEIKFGELVLDAGTGTGNLAMRIHEKGARVIGIDFSPQALAVYKSKKEDAEIFLTDLTEELHMFKDNTFDKVVSNNVLYNIPREQRLFVVKELKRVLKFGGKIVLSNIHDQFQPAIIYRAAISDHRKENGFLHTVKHVVSMASPTIKMFYYNFHIKRKHKSNSKNLFLFNEQYDLLKEAGFLNISETKLVYAEQGILNSGIKG